MTERSAFSKHTALLTAQLWLSDLRTALSTRFRHLRNAARGVRVTVRFGVGRAAPHRRPAPPPLSPGGSSRPRRRARPGAAQCSVTARLSSPPLFPGVFFFFFLRGRGEGNGNSGSIKYIKPVELFSFQNSRAWSRVPEHPDLMFLSIASADCIRGRKTANKVEFEFPLRKTIH